MSNITLMRVCSILVISGILISGCNLPGRLLGVEPTLTFTPTFTMLPSQTDAASSPTEPAVTPNSIQSIESVTPSSSATPILVSSPTFTPVPTFTPAPTQPSSITTGIQGVVMIVKPSRAMPIGGAAVTLYSDKTDDDFASTITVMDGTYRITQVPSGKYYLVVVWVLSTAGAWPCADEKIPPAGNRYSWHYEDGGMPIYVEISTKTNGNIIIAMSTGSFGVTGTRKIVDIPLICNQLK